MIMFDLFAQLFNMTWSLSVYKKCGGKWDLIKLIKFDIENYYEIDVDSWFLMKTLSGNFKWKEIVLETIKKI